MCLWGFIDTAVNLRGQIPENPDFGGMSRHFQAKHVKNANSYFQN